MTARLVLGIDPGVTGALAVLADGKFAAVHDLPMRLRRNGHQELDGYQFSRMVRGIVTGHPGAAVTAVLEEVNARAPQREAKPLSCAKCGQHCGHMDEAKMGATSAFQFGAGFGALRGILESNEIAIGLVTPAKWKRDTGLQGLAKDYARAVAVQCYPTTSDLLKRKKDIGRAEALLLARWGDRMERAGATVADLKPTPAKPAADPQPDQPSLL